MGLCVPSLPSGLPSPLNAGTACNDHTEPVYAAARLGSADLQRAQDFRSGAALSYNLSLPVFFKGSLRSPRARLGARRRSCLRPAPPGRRTRAARANAEKIGRHGLGRSAPRPVAQSGSDHGRGLPS